MHQSKCKYGNYWHEERKGKRVPVLNKNIDCNFEGYDASLVMSETAKLGNLITKRGTLETLIPLCCTISQVRHKQFDSIHRTP